MSISFTPCVKTKTSSGPQSQEILNQGKVLSKQYDASGQNKAEKTFQQFLKGEVQEGNQEVGQETEGQALACLQFLFMFSQLDINQLKSLSDQTDQLNKTELMGLNKAGNKEFLSLLQDFLSSKEGQNNLIDFFSEKGKALDYKYAGKIKDQFVSYLNSTGKENKGFDQQVLRVIQQLISESKNLSGQNNELSQQNLKSHFPSLKNLSSTTTDQESEQIVSDQKSGLKSQSIIKRLHTIFQRASEDRQIDQQKREEAIQHFKSIFSKISQKSPFNQKTDPNLDTDKLSQQAKLSEQSMKGALKTLQNFSSRAGQENQQKVSVQKLDLQPNLLSNNLDISQQNASTEANVDQQKDNQLIRYLRSFNTNSNNQNCLIHQTNSQKDMNEVKLEKLNFNPNNQIELKATELSKNNDPGKYSDHSKGTNWGSLDHNFRGVILGNRWTFSFNESQSLRDSPVTDKQVIHQVISKLQSGLKSGKSQISVNMHPPELGRVKLKLLSNNSGLQAQLQVQNLQVQDIMERNMPILREALNQQGLDFDSIQVGVESDQEENSDRYNRDEDLKSRNWRSRLSSDKELDELKEEVGINPDNLKDLNGISIRV